MTTAADGATAPATTESENSVTETDQTTAATEAAPDTAEATPETAPADTAEATPAPAEGVEVVVGDDAPVVVPAQRAVGERPIITVGRRKRAIVRVRLVPGTGVFTLNDRDLDSYFPNKVHQQLVKEPLTLLEKEGAYDVIARLHGGGVTGQAGALQLGIARALIEINPDDRPAIKRAGFLTRDPRVKERKKYGLKKARKAPQYSKR